MQTKKIMNQERKTDEVEQPQMIWQPAWLNKF